VCFRIAQCANLCVVSLALLLIAIGHCAAQGQSATKTDDQNVARTEDKVPENSTSHDNDRKQQREESLKAMESRALQVTVRPSDVQTDAELIAIPLLRYTDEPRRIFDATVWGWVAEGRLLAVCKIEHNDREGYPLWSTCFVSMATRRIEAEWSGGRRWSARKAGIELQTMNNTTPATAGGQISRLREMKEIAARFKATIIKPRNNREEMRLFPRPVFRYETPTGNLLDGAAFGLTSNGTNPDAILVLELHESKGSAAEWKFGIAGMTAGELSVKLDDKEVWSKPSADGPGRFDSWLWFSERD
jgi:hypothetical protein